MQLAARHLGVRGLNDFVPGRFTVPENPVINGLGDFVLGRFTLPQNPILDAAGLGALADFVGGKFSLPQNPIYDASFEVMAPGMGAFVPSGGMYDLGVENSVMQFFRSGGSNFQQGISGLRGLGCGGGCSSRPAPCGCQRSGTRGSGLGDLSTIITDVETAVSNTFHSLTSALPSGYGTWILLGGGALLLSMLVFGRHGTQRSAYQKDKSALKKQYSQDLQKLRGKYPRTAIGRLRRAGSAAAGAF